METAEIWVATFDIGHRNFSFYVEAIDREALANIPMVPSRQRHEPDGTPTKEFRKVLKKLYTVGHTILMRVEDIGGGCKKGDNKSAYLREVKYNMNDLLDRYRNYWNRCDVIVIEEQMNFGKNKTNKDALELAHHCESYFLLQYSRFKQVMMFPAYHKTQLLGIPKVKAARRKNGWAAPSKDARKKWAVEKARAILSYRDDMKTLQQFESRTKKDDMADCILHAVAFTYIHLIE